MQYSPSESIPIVLKHRFQKVRWEQLTNSPEMLRALVEEIVEQLSSLELLAWTDVSDSSAKATRELTVLHPAFKSFGTVALNVYGDNVGFDVAQDTQHLRDTKRFLNEILQLNKQ